MTASGMENSPVQKRARVRLAMRALRAAASDMISGYRPDDIWGQPALLPFDNLTMPQRMLVLTRLARQLSEGQLGFLPRRAYGDAGFVYILDMLKSCLFAEVQQQQQSAGHCNVDNPWREAVRAAALEVGWDDDVPDDRAAFEVWRDLIDCLTESYEIDPCCKQIDPIFTGQPPWVYWDQLQYRPSLLMAHEYLDEIIEVADAVLAD